VQAEVTGENATLHIATHLPLACSVVVLGRDESCFTATQLELSARVVSRAQAPSWEAAVTLSELLRSTFIAPDAAAKCFYEPGGKLKG